MTSHQTDDSKSFEAFLKRRADVALAYVNGDAGPLEGIVASEHPATFYGPGGGVVEGPSSVTARYLRDAQSFAKGSENSLEILHMGADGGIGYWTGYQRASARLKGKPEPVPMALRVTEIFRREGDDWKMVHRHADMLTEEQKR